MKKFLNNQIKRTTKSFQNVWRDKYPPKLHIFNAICGFILAFIFSFFLFEGGFGFKILLTLFLWPFGSLSVLFLTYGVIRARNAWKD